MIEFNGFYLDKQNIVTPGVNSEGEVTWWLITFLNEVVDNTIDIGKPGEKFFDMKEIDPNNFEWNGQHLRIDFGGSNEEENSHAVAKGSAPAWGSSVE